MFYILFRNLKGHSLRIEGDLFLQNRQSRWNSINPNFWDFFCSCRNEIQFWVCERERERGRDGVDVRQERAFILRTDMLFLLKSISIDVCRCLYTNQKKKTQSIPLFTSP